MKINHITNELDIIDAGLITESPTRVLSAFLQTHAWIVTVLMLIIIASGVYRCYKTKKQDSDEKDIKNMFNEDGTKNQHYAHKDYDPFPCFAFALLLFIVRLLLAVLQVNR